MSLQVWLPLNGDLKNQGLSDVTVNNNGATVNNNGKIGKCYSFNGSGNYLRFLYPVSNLIGEWSFSCWLKINNITQNFTLLSSRKSMGNGLSIFIIAGKVRFDNGKDNVSSQCHFDTSLTANIWQHICLVQTKTQRLLYIDGILKETKDFNYITFGNTAQYMLIGGSGNDDSTPTGNWLNGYLNDFRIYDHCLSYKEVKEIAKGLVLHYPLNKPMPNLLKNSLPHTTGSWSKAGTDWSTPIITESDGVLTAKTSYSGTSQISGGIHHPCGVSAKTDLENGQIYTLSAWIRASKNCVCTFQNELMTTSHSINVTTNWQFYKYSCIIDTSRNYWSNVVYVRAADVIQNMWVEVRQMKLEQSDHFTGWIPNESDSLYAAAGYASGIVYDCSGYQNNGTEVGTITGSSDTPRYRSSEYFDGIDSAIQIPYNATVFQTNFTINLWFKKTELGSKDYETLFGGPSGFEMDTRNDNSTTLSLYMTGTRGGNAFSSFSFNEWYMVTMVNDGTNELYYINGELKKTIEKKSMPTGNYFIGAWSTSSEQNFKGYISDFRIYCTALSAADIKALYNDAGYVDKNGNFHAYEFVEI